MSADETRWDASAPGLLWAASPGTAGPATEGPATAEHTSTGPVRVLVTGFEPFDGAATNASWEAVSHLPESLDLPGGPAVLDRQLLPVTFAQAPRRAAALIRQTRPDAVVLVGLHGTAGSVRIETRAFNEERARIVDNAGARPDGDLVIEGGPAVLAATWPVHALLGRLQAAGLPVQASDDAGRFVCNATMYAALHAAAGPAEPFAARSTTLSGRESPGSHDAPLTGFVHVPPQETLPTQRTVEALTAVIGELVGLVQRHRAWHVRASRLSVPRGGRVLRVGLTGGIGSGKSTVARMLGERGALVVDADRIAREVVEPGTPGLARVVERFGQGVLAPDGSLDRAALAAVVFGDTSARDDLEAILLPEVARTSAERIEGAGPRRVGVYDVPLLAEGGMADIFDVVIVVESPLDIRLDRLAQRGLAPEAARARIATQSTDAERRALADVVVLNDGSLAALAAHVDRLWGTLAAEAERTR